MASITEVSKLAGVSVATVSRVINGNPRVAPQMVKAVNEAMRNLGYKPPEDGRVGRPRRSPTGMRTGAVAVFFPDQNRNALRTALSGHLLHGIEEALRARSLTMIVTALDDNGELPPAIREKQVDGIIVRSGWTQQPYIEPANRVPHVWMFEQRKTAITGDIILEDNLAIGAEAAKYLLRLGHSEMAFINLMPEHPCFRMRGRAFQMELEEANAQTTSITLNGSADDAVRRLLDENPQATGIFVPGADDQVRDMYRALKRAKVRVGEKVHLISCNNDTERLATLDPTLPNIDIQAEAIGRAAVETLLWRLRHPKEPQRKVMVAPMIVTPVSTD